LLQRGRFRQANRPGLEGRGDQLGELPEHHGIGRAVEVNLRMRSLSTHQR
jgi:hypothetical protein